MMLDQSDDKGALTSQSETRSVAIIGSGLIGSSWAIVFSRAGWTVRLFDSDKNALDKAKPLIAEQLDLLIRSGLDSASRRPKEIIYTSSIEEALTDADYVQECGPEILELKKKLFDHFQGVVKRSCILASSTSGIVASKFSENLRCRGGSSNQSASSDIIGRSCSFSVDV